MMIPTRRIKRLHFIGIGGAGMSGIAEVLAASGFAVSGSDMVDGPVLQRLRDVGVHVAIGHSPANVEGADLVVHSSAVRPENPEWREAERLKIPVVRRAEMLGELMRLKFSLAIAGTHGKTTTTSMVGDIWRAAGLDPTIIVGGVVRGLGTGAQVGASQYLVAEADEFDRSFLAMMPTVALITNIDADHLDCYRDLDDIKDAFVLFTQKVPFYGQVVACIDDPGVQAILPRVRKPVVTYGFSRQADYRIESHRSEGLGSRFVLVAKGKNLGAFSLQIPGTHNIANAAAAAAAALEEGVSPDIVRQALGGFSGVKRRFELVGEAGGVKVYDDYAHHPTEVAATLHAARSCFPNGRVVVVFQPHLFTRTRDHHEAFGAAFMDCDRLIVADVYPAREAPIAGVTGDLVAQSASRRGHRDATFEPDRARITDLAVRDCRPGDAILLMGAGNINQLAKEILGRLG